VVIAAYNLNPQPAQLASVWDWSHQFAEDQIALFYNPLYIILREDSSVIHSLTSRYSGNRKDVKKLGLRTDSEEVNHGPRSRLGGDFRDNEVSIKVSLGSLASDILPNTLSSDLEQQLPPIINIEGHGFVNGPPGSKSRNLGRDGGEHGSEHSSSDGVLLDEVSPDSPNNSQRSDTLNLQTSLPLKPPSSLPLFAQASIPALSLWSLCFLRWLAPATIFEGGAACEYLIQCLVVEEILHLERAITAHKDSGRKRCERRKSMLIFSPTTADDPDSSLVSRSSNDSSLIAVASPVNSVNSGCVTSSFPFAVAPPSRVTDRSPVGGNYIDEYFKNSLMHSVTDTTNTLYGDEDD